MVWIEIWGTAVDAAKGEVTTFAVVWIEIMMQSSSLNVLKSPPSRWCGLKSVSAPPDHRMPSVTTFAVVWIEIGKSSLIYFC